MSSVFPVAIVVAVLALDGCGHEQPSRTPGASTQAATLLAAAVHHAAHVSSYRMTMTMRSNMSGKDLLVRIRGNASANGATMWGHMDYREEQTALSGEVILTTDEGYLRSKRLARVLPAGKEWLRVSDPEFAQQSLTPGQFFDLIRNTTGARIVGKDQILSHPTTHLRALVNVRKLLGRAPDGPVAQRLNGLGDALDRVHMSVDIWVDDANAMRRLTGEMSESGRDGSLVFDMVMEKENVSLKRARPPRPALVVDEADLPGGGDS